MVDGELCNSSSKNFPPWIWRVKEKELAISEHIGRRNKNTKWVKEFFDRVKETWRVWERCPHGVTIRSHDTYTERRREIESGGVGERVLWGCRIREGLWMLEAKEAKAHQPLRPSKVLDILFSIAQKGGTVSEQHDEALLCEPFGSKFLIGSYLSAITEEKRVGWGPSAFVKFCWVGFESCVSWRGHEIDGNGRWVWFRRFWRRKWRFCHFFCWSCCFDKVFSSLLTLLLQQLKLQLLLVLIFCFPVPPLPC